MARHRRNRRGRGRWWILLVPIAAGTVLWWRYGTVAPLEGPDSAVPLVSPPVLISDRPETPQAGIIRSDVTEKGAETPAPTSVAASEPAADRARRLVEAGKQAIVQGDIIAARTHFSEALQLGVPESDAALLRAELTRLGSETIFSSRMVEGDPFIERYVVQAGDSLAKIAAANKVSSDLLAEINGIRNKNLIRAGQTIKIIKGPFHAVVHKSSYTMDVFLDKTFVKHFRVGLGADDSTPSGLWQVGTKLINPDYYPPRGGKIIPGDDPDNPLGERWIALVGVSGEATGQQRYGIHGTNEPDSIGQSVSLGCIRLYNEDVEALYAYLIEKHSTVRVDN